MKDIEINGFVLNQNLKDGDGDLQSKIFTGKISFGKLKKVFELSSRIEVNSTNDNLYSSERMEGTEQHFQRYIDKNRISDMKKYILGKKDSDNNDFLLHSFPTSILLWPVNEEDYELTETDYGSKLRIKVEFEYDPKVLIVDGQHRFYTLLQLYKELLDKKKIDDFEFPCVFILNTGIMDMSKLFGYINKFQKPLNSSLFYDIFGSYPGDDSQIAFAHNVAQNINTSEGILKGKINMLGLTKKHLDRDVYLTQSFFIRLFIKHTNPFKVFREHYLKFTNNDFSGVEETSKFINLLFEIISEEFNKQWRESETPLKKTNGVGAILRILDELYYCYQKNGEKELRYKFRLIKNKNLEEKLFGKSSIFSGGGSDGIQNRLSICLKKYMEFDLSEKEKEKLNEIEL